MDDESLVLMRAATVAHKAGLLEAAEAGYRSVLSRAAHAGASLLLGGVLLARGPCDQALRHEALALARASAEGVEARELADATRILVRYGYFLLQFAGVVAIEAGEKSGARVPVGGDGENLLIIAQATAALEKATALDPHSVLGFRHLGAAYSAAGRLPDAARAAAQAVDAFASGGPGAAAPWDLHYIKGKAAKRAGDPTSALLAYCDAAEASGGLQALPLFWLRVALAPGGERGIAPAALDRAHTLVDRFAALGDKTDSDAVAGGGGVASASACGPPADYVRRLFDGYAAHFDEHLVKDLDYQTPIKLLALANRVAPPSASAARQSKMAV